MGNKLKKGFKGQQIAPYVFIGPWILTFLIFGIYPMFYSITMSFFKWTAGGPQEFRGLGNFVKLLTIDPYFKRSLYNSFILMIFGSGLQHVFAIPLAIVLNDKSVRGKDFFKVTFFLPYITSVVSIVLIFSQLFDENYGWLNYIVVHLFGAEKIRWLTESIPIKASISIMLNWQFIGWNTLIYLAGLQAIDESLYEAAEIDGATKLQQAMQVTLPLLKPVVFFTLTLSIIGGFQIFEQPFVLLGGYGQMGGPGNAGLTSAFYLMATAFSYGRYGKASATAWLMFIVVIGLTILHKKIAHEEKE